MIHQRAPEETGRGPERRRRGGINRTSIESKETKGLLEGIPIVVVALSLSLSLPDEALFLVSLPA